MQMMSIFFFQKPISANEEVVKLAIWNKEITKTFFHPYK